jgi:hypothetical protein
MDELRLRLLAGGQLVTLIVCPKCAAVVTNIDLHRTWHAEAKP